MNPTRFYRAFALLSLLAIAAAPSALAQRRAEQPRGSLSVAELDRYITQGMRDWRVPGLAIAVVHGDSIVMLKGYGVRSITSRDPVDIHTRFGLASDSKAFTGALLAMLADSGKIHWDDRVTSFLPTLQLYDPYVTRELTVRDLLTHRVGLARADLMWSGGYGYTTDDIIRRVRYLKPTWGFRTHYGYSNVMYGLSGEVAARAAGAGSWAELIRTHLFEPAGMTSCTTARLDTTAANIALPYAVIDDTLQRVRYSTIGAIPAAGDINSCAADMAQWLRFQLDSGIVNGKRLVSGRNFRETHMPQIALRIDSAYHAYNPDTHVRSYAFGWNVMDYHGAEMLSHAGNLSGMSAMVGLLPQQRVGVVVLTNLDEHALRESLMYWIFDRYLGAPNKDWSRVSLIEKHVNDSISAADDRERWSKRVTGTNPTLALDRYAGSYRDTLYGNATVRVENGHLVLAQSPNTVGDLEHWQYDTFRAVWRDHRDGKTLVTFELDPETGGVKTLRFVPDPGEAEEQVPVYRRLRQQ